MASKKRPTKTEPLEVPGSFAAVAAAFKARTDVELARGWGAHNVVLKRSGKIFVMLQNGKLVAKLPKPRVDELAANSGERFDPRGDGRVMKEWIVVGPNADWVALAREAYAFGKR
jgi:hypothetical protein